jgi:hypothetical protein
VRAGGVVVADIRPRSPEHLQIGAVGAGRRKATRLLCVTLVRMVTWEYHYIYWYWDLTGDPIAPGHALMQKFGSEGWELVSVTAAPNVGFQKPPRATIFPTHTHGIWYTATFKRQLPNST